MKCAAARNLLQSRWAPGISLILICGLLVTCAVVIGMPTQTDYPWSASVLLDGGWRMIHGQIPHQDFHTPIGPIYLLVVATAMRIFGSGPDVLGWVASAFFLTATFSGWFVAQRRMTPWPAVAAALACGIMALTPALFGSSGMEGLSFGGHYTRVAWALFSVVALAALTPPRSALHKPARYAEAVILGVLLALAAGCKVTFGPAGLALLVLAQVVQIQRRSLGEWLTLSGIAVLCGCLLLVAAGTTWSAYLTDLSRSATSVSLLRLLVGSLNDLNLVWVGLFVGGIILVGRQAWSEWHFSWRQPLPPGVIMMGALAGGGVALSATNGIEHMTPIVVAVALVSWARASIITDVQQRRAVTILAMVAIATWTLQSLAPLPTLLRAHKPALATLPDGPYAGHEFMFAGVPAVSDEALLDNLSRNPYAYRTDVWWRYLRDGCNVLQPHIAPTSRVLSLDFVNPFPYALGLPPLTGDHLFWHFQRNITAGNAPSADELFTNADFVLEPLHPIFADSVQQKRHLYGTWLATHATEVLTASSWWRLYRVNHPSTWATEHTD